MIKGADINCDSYLTLGKPDFDAFSKNKAAGTTNVSLVSHVVFIESIVKYLEGKINASQLFDWLVTPGPKTLDNLELVVNLLVEK